MLFLRLILLSITARFISAYIVTLLLRISCLCRRIGCLLYTFHQLVAFVALFLRCDFPIAVLLTSAFKLQEIPHCREFHSFQVCCALLTNMVGCRSINDCVVGFHNITLHGISVQK